MFDITFHGYGRCILEAFSITLVVMGMYWIAALLEKMKTKNKVKRYLSTGSPT